MFIGAINHDVRAILYEIAGMINRPVYVGCSGNFTCERVLWKAGVRDLHSNDVSLYSCYLGAYLSGRPFNVEVGDARYAWLRQFLFPGIPTIATLLLCSELFQYMDRPGKYFERMVRAYKRRFAELHAATMERVTKALAGLRVSSFYAGDVVDFMERAPQDIMAACFPPTYKGGYERMYKKMDEVFNWDKPDYVLFDDKRFYELVKVIQQKEQWLILKDKAVQELEPYLCGVVQTGLRSKPVFLYSNFDKRKLALPRQKVQDIMAPRLGENDEITGQSVVTIAPITQGQMNCLRSEYLNPGILPGSIALCLAVLVDGKIIGALGFKRCDFNRDSLYMMTDFAIRPTKYKRLSKLVLAAAVSTEVLAITEQALRFRAKIIETTAFTRKPVSMKYRGLFELCGRKEDKLNYIAQAGQWTLEEGLKWWLEKHSQK